MERLKKILRTKKGLLALSLILLSIVVISAGGLWAWFTQEGSETNLIFTAGQVKYELSDLPYIPSEDILPGDALMVMGFSLTNKSTIDTNIRIQATYKITPVEGSNALELTGTIGVGSDLIASLKNGWYLSNGYYYLGTSEAETTIEAVEDPNTGVLVVEKFLQTLVLNGDRIGNEYMGATVTITFTFQAKQAKSLTWEDCATKNIDFSTGLARVE